MDESHMYNVECNIKGVKQTNFQLNPNAAIDDAGHKMVGKTRNTDDTLTKKSDVFASASNAMMI